MKTVLVNASPRKHMNTVQLLAESQRDAASVGAETHLVNLFDLSFTGCRACLACKRKGAERCHCFWKDDLSPLIDEIFAADALIVGTPIFTGEPTAAFRAFFERLAFCTFSYDDYSSYFAGHVNLGLIYTMNADQAGYEKMIRPALQGPEQVLAHTLKGKFETYASFDTLQVKDYSRYSMGAFSEEHKREWREWQFPLDLAACRKMGEELSAQA